jgi:hypothetical protein
MKIAWFTIPLLAGLLIGSLPFVIARLMSWAPGAPTRWSNEQPRRGFLYRRQRTHTREHVMTWTSDRAGVVFYTVLGMLIVLSSIYIPAWGAHREQRPQQTRRSDF